MSTLKVIVPPTVSCEKISIVTAWKPRTFIEVLFFKDKEPLTTEIINGRIWIIGPVIQDVGGSLPLLLEDMLNDVRLNGTVVLDGYKFHGMFPKECEPVPEGVNYKCKIDWYEDADR